MAMSAINMICAFVGAAGTASLFIGLMQTVIVMGFMGRMIGPPLSIWIGLFLIMSAGMLFLTAHLVSFAITGDFP